MTNEPCVLATGRMRSQSLVVEGTLQPQPSHPDRAGHVVGFPKCKNALLTAESRPMGVRKSLSGACMRQRANLSIARGILTFPDVQFIRMTRVTGLTRHACLDSVFIG